MRQLSYKIILLALALIIIPINSQAEEPGIYSRTIFAVKEPKLINFLLYDAVQNTAGHTKYLDYASGHFTNYNDKYSIGFNKAMSLNIVGLDNQDDKDSQQPIQDSNEPGEPDKTNKRPPLNAWRITGEVLFGSVAGFIVAIPGGLIGGSLYSGGGSEEDPWGLGVIEYVSWGIFIGYTLGSAIGVYSVGIIGNETGSFLATLGGSILGYAIGITHMFYYNDENAILVFINPPIFATVAFNLTRKYEKSTDSPTALINFDDCNMNFAVPIVYFKPDSYNGKLIYSIDLVRAKF